VSQLFLSVFSYPLVKTLATGRKSCHLTGEMLNLTAKAGDRARIRMHRTDQEQLFFHLTWHTEQFLSLQHVLLRVLRQLGELVAPLDWRLPSGHSYVVYRDAGKVLKRNLAIVK
jgi:hypothetical protein